MIIYNVFSAIDSLYHFAINKAKRAILFLSFSLTMSHIKKSTIVISNVSLFDFKISAICKITSDVQMKYVVELYPHEAFP